MTQEPETQLARQRLRAALREVTTLELFALAVGLVAVVLFGALARLVLAENFDTFNRGALQSIHTIAAPWLDSVALALTSLGSVPAIVVMGVMLSWVLFRVGRRIDAWTLGVVLAGAGIMSVTLKIFFGVPRPEVFTPLYIVTNPSFPSGHSLISFSLWGFVAVLLVRRWPASPLAWVGACAALLLAALVAMTRLYIGVHWPTDVVAGMLLAAAWLAFCFWGRKLVRERYARLSSRSS